MVEGSAEVVKVVWEELEEREEWEEREEREEWEEREEGDLQKRKKRIGRMLDLT